MSPDVNITINLAGSSAQVSTSRNASDASASDGPPPDEGAALVSGTQNGLAAPAPGEIEVAGSTLSDSAPGPEDTGSESAAIASAAPGPEESGANNAMGFGSAPGPEVTATDHATEISFGGAPPPEQVVAALSSIGIHGAASDEIPPGPEINGTVTSHSENEVAPAPDLENDETKSKPARKKTTVKKKK